MDDFEQVTLRDIDRYVTDDYVVSMALAETANRYSVAIYVNANKIGVTAYNQYWHYSKDELKAARKTYREVTKLAKEIVEDMVWSEVPASLVQPMLKNAIYDVDPEHKESAIHNYNRSLIDFAPVGDWRESLYGERYPVKRHQENLSEYFVPADPNQSLTQENQGRGKVYRYRYSDAQPS